MADPSNTLLSSRARWAFIAVVGLALAGACSGDDDGDAVAGATTPDADGPTTTVVDRPADPEPADPEPADPEPADPEPAEPATAEPVTYTITPREPQTGIVDVGGAVPDDGPLRFVSHVDLVRHGVELDVWTEPEGVIALLRAQLGEIPRSSIEGLELVITPSGTSLLHLAADLADDASTPEADRVELERLLAGVVPPPDFFDHLADQIDEDEPSGFRRPARDTHPAQADTCVEPDVSSFPFVGEVTVDCWKVMSRFVNRPTGGGYSQLRIAYPESSEAQAEATMEALELTVETGHGWSGANPDTSVLISPDPISDDDGDPVWGAATGVTDRHCAVTLVVEDSAWDAPYRQMVAHEQVHCLQFADFDGFSGADDWFIEGGAEYFSHVVYPEGGNEREYVTSFLTESLTTGLPAMSYEAWPWWQHLSNLSSPADVFDLHRRMAAGDAVGVLAGEAGMAATFQEFTIDLMTTGIPTHGAPIEASSLGNDAGRIDSTGDRSETVERFVAARFGLSYAEQHLFEQTDRTASAGLMQMALVEERLDRSAWRGLPPEVRSSCTDDVTYLMAATTINPEPHTVEWTVDVADEFTCDPCLGGTWVLDNDSFLAAIMSLAGDGIPAGMDVSIDIVGPYHLRFDGEGAGNAWRDDWRMVTSGSMQGMSVEVVTTMASIETFEYSADGERFEAWNAVTHDSRTTVDMGGLPIGAVATPDAVTASVFGMETTVGNTGDGPQSAGGSYTCDDARLQLVLDEAPGTPIAWDRVDDIPEPPLVLTDD